MFFARGWTRDTDLLHGELLATFGLDLLHGCGSLGVPHFVPAEDKEYTGKWRVRHFVISISGL